MWLTVLNISQKIKGIIGRIWDFFLEHPNILVGVAYLYVFFLGMMYALSYYQSFEIDIFAYTEPLDFLLIAFSKASILFGILLGILLVLVSVTLILLILLLILGLIFTAKAIWAWIVNVSESIKNSVSWMGKSIGNCGLWVKNIFGSPLSSAGETFTKERERIKGEFDDSNKDIREKLDNSRKVAVASFCRNLQSLKGLFWFFYPCVFVTAILFSFILPRYHAEQDAQILLSSYPINQDYNRLLCSYFYSVNWLQSVVLGKKGGQQKPHHVRVTIRQDALQPKTRLPIPDRTFLIGTTSSFNFFYECENASRAGVCKNGRPFIIPTANIASLEFIRERVPSLYIRASTKFDTTINALKFEKIEVINIITELDTIIRKLRFETIEITDAITQINTIITSINMSSETRTELMIPKIASPKLESVAHIAPDEIVALAIALKSYLEGKTPITRLNETIKTLNKNQNNCALGLEKIATIGPFPEAKHDRLEKNTKTDSDQPVDPAKLIEEIHNRFKNHQTLQYLMLIGRVDSESFMDEALQFYGTQIKLAEARAKWVLGELMKEFSAQIDPDRTILLSAGPQPVGKNGSDINRAKDRSVEVWACWTPKPTSPSADSPVRKGQTGD